MTKPRKVLLIATAALLLGTAAHAGSQTTLPPLAELIPKGNQGNAVAQFAVGLMYEIGQSVPQDYAEAMKWFRKAADQGNVDGQIGVGALYFDGHGVSQNYAEAMKWYRKAADQGDSFAQLKVGVMYEKGQSVPQDYAEAVRWYRKAADQGDTRAEFMVGFSYIRGKGVPTDFVQAHMWLSLVAASDGENQQVAAQQRDALATMMSRAQIAEAERLTREWKPNK